MEKRHVVVIGVEAGVAGTEGQCGNAADSKNKDVHSFLSPKFHVLELILRKETSKQRCKCQDFYFSQYCYQ